jgi:hypothetical protein
VSDIPPDLLSLEILEAVQVNLLVGVTHVADDAILLHPLQVLTSDNILTPCN